MSELTFQVEPFGAVIGELVDLLLEHRDAVPSYTSAPVDPDFRYYELIDNVGRLCIVTARARGMLVGYYAATVGNDPHHSSVKVAHADLYYLKPEYRRGGAGAELMGHTEVALAAKGAEYLVTSTPVGAADKSSLLLKLGYKETQREFVKKIGGCHGQPS